MATGDLSPHWSLARIREYLKTYSPPEEELDPAGQWDHTYAIWVFGGTGRYEKMFGPKPDKEPNGFLRLIRNPLPGNGVFQLKTKSSVGLNNRSVQETVAEARCTKDALATLVSWTLESIVLDPGGKPIPDTKFREFAVVRKGVVELKNAKTTRQVKVGEKVTSNWSLFDAVQRLVGHDPSMLAFDMLEDLRLLRPNQELRPDEPINVELGGKKRRLRGFHQIGEGILPTHYWLDEQGRLLFVVGGVRVYIFQNSSQA